MVEYGKYRMIEENGTLTIENKENGTIKNVKMKFDYDFVFKCQKTQIKSRFSASELLAELQSYIDNNFKTAYINTICKNYVG